MNIKKITIALFTLALILGLSGCGRSGPPLKPSVAAAKQAKEDKQPAPEKPTPNSQNKNKRFVLDGLLE